MRHVARQVAELPPVVGDAADRQAAEADPVIAARAADEHGALRRPGRAVIGKRDLQRRIHRFGTRIGEEHMVQIARQQRRNPRRQLELERMPHLERRRIVHAFRLALDRLDDLAPPVAGVDAPEPCRGVEDPPPVGGSVVHPFRRYEKPWRRLELPVRRERHPQCVEIRSDSRPKPPRYRARSRPSLVSNGGVARGVYRLRPGRRDNTLRACRTLIRRRVSGPAAPEVAATP